MLKPGNLPVTSDKNNVEIIAQETPYHGFFSLDLYRSRYRLFSGQMGHEIRREISERGHAAALLPLDPVRDEVVLTEQIRIAAHDTNETPWLLKMVAGIIEGGENVKGVIRRKAIEKAGLIVKRTKPALSSLASPGDTNEHSSIMMGEVDATTASGVHGLADENENIRIHVISREQAYQ